jgi:hypothetical protein
MREAGALVIVGEHEHLGLAGQAAERARVEDAVAVAFEARAPRIGRLVDHAVAATEAACGQRGEHRLLALLTCGAGEQQVAAAAGPRVGVGEVDAGGRGVACHRGGPLLGALVHSGHRTPAYR